MIEFKITVNHAADPKALPAKASEPKRNERLEWHLDQMLTIADDSAVTNTILNDAWVEHKDAADLLDGDVRTAYYVRVRDGVAIADLDEATAKRYQNARAMWSRCVNGRSDTKEASASIVKAAKSVLALTRKEYDGETVKVLREALKQAVAADKATKAAKKG